MYEGLRGLAGLTACRLHHVDLFEMRPQKGTRETAAGAGILFFRVEQLRVTLTSVDSTWM